MVGKERFKDFKIVGKAARRLLDHKASADRTIKRMGKANGVKLTEVKDALQDR